MTYLRKRPQQERAVATFEAIVEATARILAEEGPDAVNTNRIAERAGVSVGSLYQYFPNRQGVVRALLEREAALAEEMRPAVLDAPDCELPERVRAIVDWHLDVHAANPELGRHLRVLSEDVLPEEERARYAARRERRVRRTLERALGGDGVDLERATFIVDVCLDALSDAAAERRPDWTADEAFRREVTALLTRYLEDAPHRARVFGG